MKYKLDSAGGETKRREMFLKEQFEMEERTLNTLEYIDKRLKELQELIYGTGKEDDEFALINALGFSYDGDYIEAATEKQTLLKIRDMLKGN
jgi:hypothetical protein